MTINLYLNNDEETKITTMFNITSNPFKVGDIIHINVNSLFYPDYGQCLNKQDQERLIRLNAELKQKFRTKTIKLVKVYNSLEFSKLRAPRITIDYYCDFIDK